MLPSGARAIITPHRAAVRRGSGPPPWNLRASHHRSCVPGAAAAAVAAAMEPATPTLTAMRAGDGGAVSPDGCSPAPTLSATDIDAGAFDDAIRAWDNRRKRLLFDRLPNTIYLVRHGQSEGNVNPKVYHHKGDSRLELTAKGLEQAREAGARLAALLEEDCAHRRSIGGGHIFVGVSPFERAQQTLYGMYDGGFPRNRVSVVLHDPRLREQEFGNFQPPGLSAAVRAEIDSVGRFYYRRPNAESSADVFDRIAAFWQCLLSDGPDNLMLGRKVDFDSCVLVTHGLTIRLLLMVVCQWSVDTFETVFNIGNCHHLALRKNADGLCYTLCPEKSYPPRVPWSSRACWVVFRSLQASDETLRQIELLRRLRSSQQGRDLGEVFGDSKRAAAAAGAGQTRSRSRAASSGSFGGRSISTNDPGREDGDQFPSSSAATGAGGGGAEAAATDGEDDFPSWPFLDRKISELEARAMDERSKPYTVVDYLTLPCPRSMQVQEALARCVPGHRARGTPEELTQLSLETVIRREDVEAIDWWGPRLSPEGRRLRMRMDRADLTSDALDVLPGGRDHAIQPRRRSGRFEPLVSDGDAGGARGAGGEGDGTYVGVGGAAR